jgi:hypothetical protein
MVVDRSRRAAGRPRSRQGHRVETSPALPGDVEEALAHPWAAHFPENDVAGGFQPADVPARVARGALADIVDKRRLLILTEIGVVPVSTMLAALVWLDRITAPVLLFFTFLLGAGAALVAPSWQSIVPLLGMG